MKAPPVEDLSQKVKSSDVINAIKGVIKFTSENPKLQNTLFKEDFPLFLQVNCFKIPDKKGSVKQLYRIPLKNCPLPPDADICLIVPDVKGVPNKEHERHLEHYETILNSKGVTGIKKVMTFHEFRTEYDTYELKNRLADLYDVFLVDGRISGKVVHKCGNIFYIKRKVPIAVKVHVPQLKTEIERALNKAFFHMNFKSDSQTVQIGQSQMKVEHLAENVFSVVEFLDKHFPGKMENIRSLQVCAHRGSSIPVYLSLKSKNEVEVPVMTGKKPVIFKLGQYAKELRAKRKKVNDYLGEKAVRRPRTKGKKRQKTAISNQSELKNSKKTDKNVINTAKKPEKTKTNKTNKVVPSDLEKVVKKEEAPKGKKRKLENNETNAMAKKEKDGKATESKPVVAIKEERQKPPKKVKREKGIVEDKIEGKKNPAVKPKKVKLEKKSTIVSTKMPRVGKRKLRS